MKHDEFMTLAKEAGLARWHINLERHVVEHGLEKFAKLVEQATLERAAKVCDDHAESHAKSATAIEEGGDDAHSVWAMATASKFAGAKIRALKDSHD